MKADRPDHLGNVIPFRKRSETGGAPADDVRPDDVLRMLDLSKFEKDRRAANGPSMRLNIAAMVLLGFLVFVATENFSKLEQSNVCSHNLECRN
ncbi:hypothetical protein [Bradyrhizobium sp. CCGE-LA001]|uniref:hypothetical protein n=1 Tax=Bradyrhizobium sp. CCGE-LA001 TaxID=1223566 RepID=UPI0011981F6F|nr:hypothetical protein [Bradyrhizobium sp. CCGE-LA001]